MFTITSPVVALWIVLAITSTALATLPFFASLHQRVWPRTCDFAAISVFLYYTIGLIAEVWQPEQLGLLVPLFGHSEATAITSLVLIAITPWILRLGSILLTPHYPRQPADAKVSISPGAKRNFYLFCSLICTTIAAQSAYSLTSTSLFTLRAETTAQWGPYIVWFFIPLALLFVFVSITDIRSKADKAMCVFLMATSVCAVVPTCERTMILMPFLVVFLFARRLTINRLVVVPLIAFLIAALLLPILKPEFANDEHSFTDLIFSLIHGDISRAGVLAHAVDESEILGSHTVPYSMAGYVYTAAFFVPRSIGPWKGDSTARDFTALMTDRKVEETDWGYGIGLIDEAVLNGGLAMSVPIILGCGLALGLQDRLRSPLLILPLRLATLWIAGYTTTAVLQMLGPEILVGLIFMIILQTCSKLRITN